MSARRVFPAAVVSLSTCATPFIGPGEGGYLCRRRGQSFLRSPEAAGFTASLWRRNEPVGCMLSIAQRHRQPLATPDPERSSRPFSVDTCYQCGCVPSWWHLQVGGRWGQGVEGMQVLGVATRLDFLSFWDLPTIPAPCRKKGRWSLDETLTRSPVLTASLFPSALEHTWES